MTTQLTLNKPDRARKTNGLKLALVFIFVIYIYLGSGVFGVKYVAFLGACIASVFTLKYLNLSYLELTTGILLFVVWPIWSLFWGTIQGGDSLIGLREISQFLFVLVLPAPLLALDKRTPLRIFYTCLFSLAIVIIISFALVFLLPENSISVAVFNVLIRNLDTKEGFFGFRSYGDSVVPIIYFGGTLFLVPTCVYYMFIGKMLRAAVTFLAVVLAFSKAGILIVLLFAVIHFVNVLSSHRTSSSNGRDRQRLRSLLRLALPFVLLTALTASSLSLFPGFFDVILDTFTGESDTAQVRIGHIHSVLNLFVDKPHYLLVGQGVGVAFYTTGESDYVQNFEVDYLNTTRKFGLPWFIGFSALVFASAWRLVSTRDMEMRAFGFALVSMYLAAGTNPMLMSANFLILMTLCYFAQRGKPLQMRIVNAPLGTNVSPLFPT
jgi:hypothetical protein